MRVVRYVMCCVLYDLLCMSYAVCYIQRVVLFVCAVLLTVLFVCVVSGVDGSGVDECMGKSIAHSTRTRNTAHT